MVGTGLVSMDLVEAQLLLGLCWDVLAVSVPCVAADDWMSPTGAAEHNHGPFLDRRAHKQFNTSILWGIWGIKRP